MKVVAVTVKHVSYLVFDIGLRKMKGQIDSDPHINFCYISAQSVM